MLRPAVAVSGILTVQFYVLFRVAFTTTLALLSLADPSRAASLSATPQTLISILSSARGGDSIRLAPGKYENLLVNNIKFKPAVILDAENATFEKLTIRNSRGLTISGGRFLVGKPTPHPRTSQPIYGQALRIDLSQNIRLAGFEVLGPGSATGGNEPFGDGYGIFVVGTTDIEVTKVHFEGLKSGIVFSRVQGFLIGANDFIGMRSDGIQVAESREGVIENNSCSGTRIRTNEHPDCIQLWSRPTSPPTADIIIRKNRAEGPTQGIALFNHIRNGVDDGGFDRIVIEDNQLTVGYPHAIALGGGRASIVRNNRVRTSAGARWRASINIGETTRCGNTVEGWAGRPAQIDLPCKK